MATVRLRAAPLPGAGHARPSSTARHLTPPPPVQYVFIKRASDAAFNEPFAKLHLEGCTDVADVVARACNKFPRWGVDAGQVYMFLVSAAAQKPTLSELEAALLGEPLSPLSALADARVVAGCCLLARVPPPAASPGAPPLRALAALSTFALESAPAASLAFPSSGSRAPCFLQDPFVALIGAPLTLPSDPLLGLTFARLLAAATDTRGMGAESRFYALASSPRRPSFVKAIGAPGGDITAEALLTTSSLGTPVWTFAHQSKPELHVRAAAGGAGQPAHCPAFNGEVKSAGDGRCLEQAVYYTAMDLVRVFFPTPPMPPIANPSAAAHDAAVDSARKRRKFYTHPPTGYALVAFPHVGYLLALEMVGKLLVSPLTQPFFLGSPQHAHAVGGLPQPPYAPPEVVELAEVQPWRTSGGPRRDLSAWCVHGGVFRKFVRGDARSGEGFAAMHAAYAALAAALPAAPAHLRLPRSVRLLYGLHEVLVEMPAVAGRAAGEEEVRRGALLPPLARAIAWLARQRRVHGPARAQRDCGRGGGPLAGGL